MPPKATFTEPDEYYETVFHELVHATEHPSRLDWSRKEKENTYALGELVAEIGACYLARELGVPASENLTNHVAYLANWLKAMKDDPRFIFTASCPGVEGRRLPPRLQPPPGRRGGRAGGGPGRMTDLEGGGTNAAHRHRREGCDNHTPPDGGRT